MPSPPQDNDRRERSSSLVRGLAVLGILLEAPFGCTLATVAHRAGLSRAAARRFLLTLCEEGLAHQSGRYFLPSLAVRALARTVVADPTFWTLFDRDMRELSAMIGESCSLATLDGSEIEYVARCQGPRVLSVSLGVGSRLPSTQTSMGRVLLASLPEHRCEALVHGVSHAKRTRRSLVDPAQILIKIHAARELGYAVLDQELEDELVSVAVPLLTPSGACLAALNVSSTPSRLSADQLVHEVVPRLIETSRAMTSRLAEHLSPEH